MKLRDFKMEKIVVMARIAWVFCWILSISSCEISKFYSLANLTIVRKCGTDETTGTCISVNESVCSQVEMNDSESKLSKESALNAW